MLKVVWVWICILDFGNGSFCVMSRIYYIMHNKKPEILFFTTWYGSQSVYSSMTVFVWQTHCIRCNDCFVLESSPTKQNKQKKGSATNNDKPAGKKRKLKDVEKEKKRQRLQQISKQQKQNKSGKPSGKPSGPHKKQQKHKKFKKTK